VQGGVEVAGGAPESVPWPEFLAGRPVLVVPAAPGRAPVPEDGWTDAGTALALTHPRAGWSAVLKGRCLSLRRPGGEAWFEGEVAATRDWRRSLRTHRSVLLVTGPFANPFELPAAAAAGRLVVLAAAARLADDCL
jgi:hypothetical protein